VRSTSVSKLDSCTAGLVWWNSRSRSTVARRQCTSGSLKSMLKQGPQVIQWKRRSSRPLCCSTPLAQGPSGTGTHRQALSQLPLENHQVPPACLRFNGMLPENKARRKLSACGQLLVDLVFRRGIRFSGPERPHVCDIVFFVVQCKQHYMTFVHVPSSCVFSIQENWFASW
jgi:hypothetical protein